VEIRASQINGCAVCIDMPHKGRRARQGKLGATQPGRGVAGAKVFTDAERAALELNEQGTRIADAAVVSPTRPGECRQALRRGPARRPGVPHRHP